MACNCKDDEQLFSLQKAVNSVTSAVKSIVKAAVVKDYTPFVDEATKTSRLEICKSCEHCMTTLKKPMCKVCGCFLNYKTSLRDQSCPHPDGEKWPAVK